MPYIYCNLNTRQYSTGLIGKILFLYFVNTLSGADYNLNDLMWQREYEYSLHGSVVRTSEPNTWDIREAADPLQMRVCFVTRLHHIGHYQMKVPDLCHTVHCSTGSVSSRRWGHLRTHGCCPTSIDRTAPYATGLGKDLDLKPEALFLLDVHRVISWYAQELEITLDERLCLSLPLTIYIYNHIYIYIYTNMQIV